MYAMFFRRPFCHRGGSGVVLMVVKQRRTKYKDLGGEAARSAER